MALRGPEQICTEIMKLKSEKDIGMGVVYYEEFSQNI